MKWKNISLYVLITLVLVGCGGAGHKIMAGSPDEDVNKIVGQQNRIYVDNQPPHIYDYSAPRDVMLQLYDAIVPKMSNTWTVFSIPGVGPIDSCPSKGYPIPFGSQITSPEYAKELGQDEGGVTLPQSEPDGLYRSGETAATWILCIAPDGAVVPEYHEEIVSTYPFPVSVDPVTHAIKRESGPSNVTVDLSRAGS